MDEEQKVSKYSSGVNILKRVDFLWQQCHNFKRTGQYRKWNEELDSVWLELARDLKEEEYYDLDSEKSIIYPNEKKEVKIKGYKSKFDEFEEELKKLGKFADSGTTGFKKPDSNLMENRDKQYKILMAKQLFLARLENEVGKGTTWEDEEEDF